MKFAYKFANLLGTIYRNGNVVFTPDGNSVISPVGNRLTIHDLKNNKSRTLSLESRYSYTSIALSPNGNLLIAINETGEAQLISMISCTVIHRHKFQSRVQCVVFSPNGEYFAVAKENLVYVFRTPGELTGQYNPFVLERCFIGGFDDVTWLDWSTDSRFLAVGCRDNSTKIIATRRMRNFRTYILTGHTDAIVTCFFENSSMNMNTLSRNGQLCLWECSLSCDDIVEADKRQENNQSTSEMKKRKKISKDSDESEEDDEEEEEEAKNDQTPGEDTKDENEIKDADEIKRHPFFYKKLSRHYLMDEVRKEHKDAVVTAAHFNRKTKIMVVAFSTGSFYLYEIPEVNIIHYLSISEYPISTALFNCTGDWVALASRELGQFLVWEWQSEHYVMKQQGHTSEMTCISYSPDGQYIATGGADAKVKLWNTQSGFCFVTFSEHTSGVTGVQFSRNKKFLVSSSLDGTVRAFDITRYRNFRTFTSPRLVQFASVAIDHSGELVAAGGQDVFEIYLWSMKFGKLLEVISGHEGPVPTLAFSPIASASTLVSGSWDKTIKIWNCLESNSEHETIDLLYDVTCVAFSPNGENVAVATTNGSITVFDIKTAAQIVSIEGRNDLGSGRSEVDIVTAKKNLLGRYFSTLEYSADGEFLLAGGQSQMICIYHVREALLMKKIEITQNHSLDGLDEYINRRNITEFGNMALVETREENEGGNVALRLPGVQKGDMATRNFKPQIRVYSVKFSPTGQAFAVACTEGMCIYSLDKGVVFDPFNLSLEVTPKAIRAALKDKEYLKSLIMALKLNEENVLNLVLESIPYPEVELICLNLPIEYAQRLMLNLARLLQATPHLEFYLHWSTQLLHTLGNRDTAFENHALLALHESMSRRYEILHKICDFNKYTIKSLLTIAEERDKLQGSSKNSAGAAADGEVSDEEMLLIKSRDDEGNADTDFTSDDDDDDDAGVSE